MIQAGVVPVTWLSLAAVYQLTSKNLATGRQFAGLMAEHSATLRMAAQQLAAQHPAPSAAKKRPTPEAASPHSLSALPCPGSQVP
jgi:hypothetical protein